MKEQASLSTLLYGNQVNNGLNGTMEIDCLPTCKYTYRSSMGNREFIWSGLKMLWGHPGSISVSMNPAYIATISLYNMLYVQRNYIP